MHTPLGLPAGSVRAVVTLLIVLVVVARTAKGQDVGILWVETLMIALAHYFTSRRFVTLPPKVLKRLEDDGWLETEPTPLYLPRHTIRSAIIAVFVVLAGYLYVQGRLFAPESISILGIVFAYFAGILFKAMRAWFRRGADRPQWKWWEDIKAVGVLVSTAAIVVVHLADRQALLPRGVENAALGLVLFYFGSR